MTTHEKVLILPKYMKAVPVFKPYNNQSFIKYEILRVFAFDTAIVVIS